jgi:OOP family OmpA-OmpF porin
VGLGAFFDRGRGWSVRADLRTAVLPAREDHLLGLDFEVFITLYRLAEFVEPPPAMAIYVRDTDGDQIADANDRCPRRIEDRDDFEDDDGCPDIDDDRDEILDISDKCKFEPEIWNGFRDHDGCPDDMPDEVTAVIGVLEGVAFAKGSDRIRRKSFKALDRVAAVLVKFPSVRGRIVGHSDKDGTPDADLDLAQRRAQAVKYYLVAKGVHELRLGAVGVGAEQPIDEEASAEASALSGRAEFQVRRREE